MNEIFIYDEIGPDFWGLVSAKKVIDQLKGFGDKADVTVRLNTPGGSVTEGQAIYNALLRHKGEVTIEVDSLAASMGSYIAMAGDTIRIAENAYFMVHNPWTITMGTAQELRDAADVLEKMQAGLVKAYAKRTGLDEEAIANMMDAETWLTASEAVEIGFAGEISETLKAAAAVRPGIFAKAPEHVISTEPTLAGKERIAATARRIEQAQQQLRISRARAGV